MQTWKDTKYKSNAMFVLRFRMTISLGNNKITLKLNFFVLLTIIILYYITKKCWVLLLLFLFVNLTFNNGFTTPLLHNNNKLQPPFVVGTVLCDTCFQHLSNSYHFISGSSFSSYFNYFSSILYFYKNSFSYIIQYWINGWFKMLSR